MSERIEINPRVCGGQPIIKGTCISVSAILEQLADSESWDFPLARSSGTDAGRYLGGLAVGPAFYSTSTHRDHRSRRGVKRRVPLPRPNAPGRTWLALFPSTRVKVNGSNWNEHGSGNTHCHPEALTRGVGRAERMAGRLFRGPTGTH